MQDAPPTRVVCAILEREGKFLLARRAPGQALEGKWELPGGKLEPGETPNAALEREIFEELGWRVVAKDFVASVRFTWKTRPFVLEAWTATAGSGDPAISVHDAFVWVGVDEVLAPEGALLWQIADADRPLLEAYRKFVDEPSR